MKRNNRLMAITYNHQQQILKDTIVSKQDVLKVLDTASMPTNSNFWTVFKNSGILTQIKRGYFQLSKNITLKGMEELFVRYKRYNRRFV